jgi:hypothetical protein
MQLCANKNALLSCETKELTATKRNPGLFTLPGLLQFVASACRLFDPGGVGGWGTPGSGLHSFNPNWLFEVARQQNGLFGGAYWDVEPH